MSRYIPKITEISRAVTLVEATGDMRNISVNFREDI
jgi:hypothetical protein